MKLDSHSIVYCALLVMGSAVLAGCFATQEESCSNNDDCRSNEVCDLARGECIERECNWDGDCSSGTICEGAVCITGCRLNEDCALAQVCHENQCGDVEADCQCLIAQEFCGEDIHPGSATFGQVICMPDSYPDGVALFFGSVACGVCRRILESLLTIHDQLATEGLQPRIIFVQSIITEITPEEVEGYLADADVAVVRNTAEANIWLQYHVAQYDMALVDRHGCYTNTFADLDREDLSGTAADEIRDAWRDAMDDICP